MNNYIRTILLSAFMLITFSGFSQEKARVVDEIIAKVDNYIILKSDLEKAYVRFLEQNNQQYGGISMKCNVLEQLVIQKLMVAKADIDSVVVADEEVEIMLDRKLQAMIAQIGSEEAIEEYYNQSLEEFKQELKEDQREQMLVSKMQQEITVDISVTPAEVKKFYNAIPRDSLPYFATEVEVSQIVKNPEIGQPQKLQARQRLQDIRRQIMQGLELTSKYQDYKLSLEEGNTLVITTPDGTYKGAWNLTDGYNYLNLDILSDVPEVNRLTGEWIPTVQSDNTLKLVNRQLEDQTNFTLNPVDDKTLLRVSRMSLQGDWTVSKAYSSGTSFAVMAKEYSDDPGSGARGGNLGFHGRGELVPPYEATALRLKPGEISEPVESEYGYHLIQLIERRGNRYDTRHILIKTTSSFNDVEAAKNYLDSLRTRILNDSISFEEAAKEYSDDKMTASSGGYLLDQMGASSVPVDQLDPTMYFTIDTMSVGSISKPIVFTQPDGSKAVKIVYFKSRIPPHQANLKQDYQKILNAALREKRVRMTNEWFEQAQREVFVYIDEDYQHCDILNTSGTAMR